MSTKSAILSVLSPHLSAIRQVVEEGWSEWQGLDQVRRRQKMAPLLYPRTVANYVFDSIARAALAKFQGIPGVYLQSKSQTFKVIINGQVCARFKKGDDEGLGSNIPTQAALAFIDPQGMLPGLPPVAKVEIIWAANALGTALNSVSVVARDGDILLWRHDLPAQTQNVVALPLAKPSAPPTGGGLPLITPKPGKGNKKSSTSDE